MNGILSMNRKIKNENWDMKKFGYNCWVLCFLFCKNLFAQKSNDSIFTVKGAVTVINCQSPISTFQLGDGKNADYDYRILDNSLILIRSQTANPKPTNLIVKEGGHVHYLILSNKDNHNLNNLRYTLSARTELNNSKSISSFFYSSVEKEDILGLDSILSRQVAANVTDTNIIARIATRFLEKMRQRSKYRVNHNNLKIGFVKAMTLNGNDYFCFRIKTSRRFSIDVQNINLVRKEIGYQQGLYSIPITYKKRTNSRTIVNLLVVSASCNYYSRDKIILLLKDVDREQRLAFYFPAKVLSASVK